MITLVFLSYHSAHHIRRILNNIDKNYYVVVIENSSDSKLKEEMETKYKNVHVEVCKENLGFSKGMNLGIKLSKTPYVFLNPADVDISNEVLNSLNDIVTKFKNFGMLTPAYKDRSVHSNFFIWSKKGPDITIDISKKKFILKEVDFIDGTILLNKEKSNNELFDENFFIYFETMDLSKRLIDKNIKLYACEDLKFDHFGGQSHEKVFNIQAQISRNWHYNWSKFYYYKKHYSYLKALKKIFPNLKRAIINYLINFFIFFKKDSQINKILAKNEIKGILSSAMLKKSSFRPKFTKQN